MSSYKDEDYFLGGGGLLFFPCNVLICESGKARECRAHSVHEAKISEIALKDQCQLFRSRSVSIPFLILN